MTTAALALLACLPLQAPLHVDGLRPGERFRPSASSVEVALDDRTLGRVVDARTGFPVAGATVETWTEEIGGDGEGLVRIGEARTGRDGGFEVRVAREGLRAEKVLVRAPGHLTFPGTLDDLALVRLTPRPPWTWRVRVVDLEDRPIPGARVTSTYSCAHDVPGVDAVSGPDGVAVLEGYGLQEHAGELRIRAPGYAGRKVVDWTEVPPDPVHGEPAPVRLARQPGFAARVLAHDGTPLADRRLHVVDGNGYHVPVTDARGAFAVEASYQGRDVVLRVLAAGQGPHVFAGTLPDAGPDAGPDTGPDTGSGAGSGRREVALRVEAHAWPDDVPTGTLVVRAPCRTVALFGVDGWAEEVSLARGGARAVEFPAGGVLVSAGGAFSGWERVEREVELAAGATVELALEPLPEPRLAVLVPDEAYRVVVQAGTSSVELAPRDGRVETPVPAGERLVVLSDGERMRRRVRAALPAPTSDVRPVVTIDLRGEGFLLPATRAQLADGAPRERLVVEVPDVGGTLTATGPGGPAVERTGPTAFTVDAPAGHAVALRFRAPGFAECWTACTTAARRVTLAPTPLASVELVDETSLGVTVEGPLGERLDALHPGPLSLTLVHDDGRRGILSLELEPGETRTLRVHDGP